MQPVQVSSVPMKIWKFRKDGQEKYAAERSDEPGRIFCGRTAAEAYGAWAMTFMGLDVSTGQGPGCPGGCHIAALCPQFSILHFRTPAGECTYILATHQVMGQAKCHYHAGRTAAEAYGHWALSFLGLNPLTGLADAPPAHLPPVGPAS